MFIQTIPNGTDLVHLSYASKYYVGVLTTAGTTFTQNRVSVTSGVSAVTAYRSSVAFDMVGDQSDVIVDNLFNVYYACTSFRQNTTTLP
jgi:hypothetical protein